MTGHYFIAASDCINHETLIFRLRQMSIGGSFRNTIIEFLTERKQRMVVDGQCSDCENVISGVPQDCVLGPLLFILYTSDMWSGLENRHVVLADEATFYASVPYPRMRPFVAEEALNRDLAKISA